MKRHKIFNKGKDRRMFSRTAGAFHKKNMRLAPNRGGWKL